jgi:sulfur relay (sulfurtransferase) complex TusBCD TusD component (DsrE family)
MGRNHARNPLDHGGSEERARLARPLLKMRRMSHAYVLLDARDPHDTSEHLAGYELALRLAGTGHRVKLFLASNAVYCARRSAASKPLEEVTSAGVEVRVDASSLAARGITASALARGVEPESLDDVLAALESGDEPIWL